MVGRWMLGEIARLLKEVGSEKDGGAETLKRGMAGQIGQANAESLKLDGANGATPNQEANAAGEFGGQWKWKLPAGVSTKSFACAFV